MSRQDCDLKLQIDDGKPVEGALAADMDPEGEDSADNLDDDIDERDMKD